LWFARKYISDKSLDLDVDIALKHAGGFVKSISGLNITRLDIGSALIYNDHIVVVQLDAKELLATIENAVSRYPTPDGRYLQTSGISIEFDKMAPGVEGRSTINKTSRVIELSVQRANGDIDVIVDNGTIQGDTTRLFGVAVNNYMFVGGDGYSAFPAVSNNSARKVILTNVGEQSILEQYISEEIEDNKLNLPVVLSESVFIGTPF
jgi:2',3'-cyclic-nucleotide 2'-phosphodiesterase (5'-nucleotidase family)